jgi:excisionase family DNA binding protein
MPIQVEDITVYNVKEISELLGITQVTIREYIKQGKLRAKKIAGEWRITGDALRDFLSADKIEDRERDPEFSTAKSLLKHSGKWKGSKEEYEKILEHIKDNRTDAEF